MAAAHAILLLPFLFGTGQDDRPQEAPYYAGLPFRDLTANADSLARMRDLLLASLEARGATFVPQDELEQALRARRIRYTSSMSVAEAQSLGASTGAAYLLTGALLEFEPGPYPRITFAARVLDAETGERTHSSLIALRGEDFRGLLGIGVIENERELELEVVARVLEDFDELARPVPVEPMAWRRYPHAPEARFISEDFDLRRAPRDPARRWHPPNLPTRFAAGDFDPTNLERVVIMPLVNRTRGPLAGVLFTELIGHTLFRERGVQVVEQSELRSALVRARLRSIDLLDREIYAKLGQDLGARYFVLGSLDLFAAEVYRAGTIFPEVEASIRVVDVEEGRIVAAASLRRRGDRYHVILGLGEVHGLVDLADRTARELIAMIGNSPQ